MIARVWSHVGQVAGLLALFIVLGGPAWAASIVDGASIKTSSVTGKQIRNSSLTGADVRNSSLTGTDVKDGTIDDRDVKDGSLTGTDVQDGSIAAGDLAPGVIPAIPAVPPFSIPDGSITTSKFADSAVAPKALALPGLRTEPNATSPNVVGGADGNSVTSGAVGASLLGGGATSFLQAVTDDFGTIAGGRRNTAGDGAGATNDAVAATVGGGEGNAATGSYATVPGGLGNSAGAFSMAAGRRAKANNTGSFVWADSTNADYSSTADNQFSIRAANGMFIANDAGGAKVVPVGTRYRDNSIVAWARVTAAGGVDSNFNVASVTHVGTGHYTINLNSSLSSGFSLMPVATPEIDG
ncbi:MAG TPA: hypothetical protein VNT55_16900, partial [Baekduia sp.]|nr:hypothetical protein [Baekduia sp.]